MNFSLSKILIVTSVSILLGGCISAKSRPVETAEVAAPAPAPAPAPVKVDLDSDGDGVLDSKDLCPDTPPGVRVDADGCEIIFTVEGVNFDTNKSTLKPAALEKLGVAASLLNSSPGKNFQIVGHTDSVGADDYNEALGHRRAVSVLNFLTKNGVAQSRLSTESFGETRPVASNDTEEGRAQNRRVEIVAAPN